LQGDELVIAKIIVGGETTEEINTFKYLGYEISYKELQTCGAETLKVLLSYASKGY